MSKYTFLFHLMVKLISTHNWIDTLFNPNFLTDENVYTYFQDHQAHQQQNQNQLLNPVQYQHLTLVQMAVAVVTVNLVQVRISQSTYSVTQVPVEFLWHWRLSSAEISIIRTIKIHILMKFMIKMIDLIDVILYMAVMTDILVVSCQCHRNFTGNRVTE